MRGDGGDDVLIGQQGSDIAIGGDGADVFEFFIDQFAVGELDTILDFTEEEGDSIVIVGSTDVEYDPVTGLVSVGSDEDDDFLIEVEADLNLEVLTRDNWSIITVAAETPISEPDAELRLTEQEEAAPQSLTPNGSLTFEVDEEEAATSVELTFSEVDDVSGSNASFEVEAFLDGESVGSIGLRRAVEEPDGTLELAFSGDAVDEIVVSDAEGDVTAMIAAAFDDGDIFLLRSGNPG